MIGNPGKTWGAFFGFSASSLQRMHRYQLAVSILVNASPLPSSSIHHQEVTFGTQAAGNLLFHQIPHRTCNVVNDPRDLSSVATCNVVNGPRDLSSVATCNVVNDPRDLSSMAIYHVRSTRNVNMPPHPTQPHNRDIQKRAFYGNSSRSAGINIYIYMYIYICIYIYLCTYT